MTVLCAFAAALVVAFTPQTVDVVVNVRTPDGQPIPNVIVLFQGNGIPGNMIRTDQQGQASWTIGTATSEAHVSIAGPLLPTDVEGLAAWENRTYKWRYKAAIPTGSAQVIFDIVPGDGIALTYQAQTDAIACFIRGVWMHAISRTPNETVRILGIPKGASTELAFIDGYTNRVWFHQLDARATSANGSLGPVTAPPAAANTARVSIQVARVSELSEIDRGMRKSSVAIVRDDAQSAYGFRIHDNGTAFKAEPPRDELLVEPGTYYVVSGLVNPNPTFWGLVDAIRAGRQAELDAANVPKITAVANETRSITIDAPAALAATRTVITEAD